MKRINIASVGILSTLIASLAFGQATSATTSVAASASSKKKTTVTTTASTKPAAVTTAKSTTTTTKPAAVVAKSTTVTTKPAKPAVKTTTKTTATVGLLDINSATKVQLAALPGIGDAYAAKIIAGRPYAKKDQLLSKHVLPQATYNKIVARIIARVK